MDLSGKVAFITASASGLGKGYAEALLEKGAKVFLSDVDLESGEATLAEFESKFGVDRVRFLPLDVRNERQFEDVFKAAVDAFGNLDIMVNNAGVLDESGWQLVLQVNVFGVVKGTKLAEEHMRKDKGGKGGRIINISSLAGLKDLCTIPVYGATKHAVRSFTISQAAQFDIAEQGIEYATICPESVDTRMRRLADSTRFHFYERVRPFLDDAMPVSQVVGAFLELVQLECMNGAILLVTKDAWTYQRLDVVDLGPNYVSAVHNWY